MKKEEVNPEESKFGKDGKSSPDDELKRLHTFKPEKDQEMFALKIISKAKVLESQ